MLFNSIQNDMILSDKKIINEQFNGNIVITPFVRSCLGSNSYDIHLSKHIACYKEKELDAKKHNGIVELEIPEEGLMLMPGFLYLGSTVEYTETHKHVPYIEGKSSTGRLGITIHATAGKGDVGFCGHWTLEMSVIHPVIVYVGMPIGQLTYFEISGEVGTKYGDKKNAKYSHQNSKPVESMMWKNIF